MGLRLTAAQGRGLRTPLTLQQAYRAIIRHAAGVPGAIVHLGDYIDRGPDSRQVVEFLMDPATVPPDWQRVCLRGNHEDYLLAGISDRAEAERSWLPSGGADTLLSYGALAASSVKAALALVPAKHIAWMRQLPRLHTDDLRIFVHAGVDPDQRLDAQNDQTLGWKRYANDDPRGHGSRHVVHGHTPHPDGPRVFAGRTNLDTRAWATGRLVIGVFDSRVHGGAIAFIKVILPQADDLR